MKIQEILSEARRRQTETKTQTKTKPKFKTRFGPDLSAFEKPASAGTQAPARTATSAPVGTEAPPTPQLRQAGRTRTRQRTANIRMPAGAGERFSALHQANVADEISDEEAARIAGIDVNAIPTEIRIENLPAVINTQIATQSDVEPEWHQVKHLPGYLKSQIRAVGRQVFRAFTSTPLEDIQVLADFQGSGPNSTREINAVAEWLEENAVRDQEAALQFQEVIPDYGAEVIVYKASGYSFMMVRDFAGRYIYAWPEHESAPVGQERPRMGQTRRRLR